MLERIKQKWVEWIFAVVLVVITTILTNYATTKRETNSVYRTQLEQKADKTYVDKQDESIRASINQGDDNMKEYFDQYRAQQKEFQQSMDAKINILLSRTK